MDPHKRRLERCVIISCVAGERGYPRKSRMRNRIPDDASAIADTSRSTIFFELSFIYRFYKYDSLLRMVAVKKKERTASASKGRGLRLW